MRRGLRASRYTLLVIALLLITSPFSVVSAVSAQPSTLITIHESRYFIWKSHPGIYEYYEKQITPLFEFADQCYERLREVLGVDPVTSSGHKITLIIYSYMGAWAGFGFSVVRGENNLPIMVRGNVSMGIDYTSLTKQYSESTTMAHVLIAHELTNVFTSFVVSGWPQDWWADHVSPFPFAISTIVLNATGHEDAWKKRLEETRVGKIDKLVNLFLQLYREDDRIYARLMKTVMEDGWISWEQVSGGLNPHKRLSEYVAAYLSMAAGRNLYKEINEGIAEAKGREHLRWFSVDPIEVYKIWHTRFKISSLPRNSTEWRRFRNGTPLYTPPILIIDAGFPEITLRINGRNLTSDDNGMIYYSEPGKDSFQAVIEVPEHLYLSEGIRARASLRSLTQPYKINVSKITRLALSFTEREYLVRFRSNYPVGGLEDRWIKPGVSLNFSAPRKIQLDNTTYLELDKTIIVKRPLINLTCLRSYCSKQVWTGERLSTHKPIKIRAFFKVERDPHVRSSYGEGFAIVLGNSLMNRSSHIPAKSALGYKSPNLNRSVGVGFWVFENYVGVMENGRVPTRRAPSSSLKQLNLERYLDGRWHLLELSIEGRNVSITIDGESSLSLSLNRSISEIIGDLAEVGLSASSSGKFLNITLGLEGGRTVTSPQDVYLIYDKRSVKPLETIAFTAAASKTASYRAIRRKYSNAKKELGELLKDIFTTNPSILPLSLISLVVVTVLISAITNSIRRRRKNSLRPKKRSSNCEKA